MRKYPMLYEKKTNNQGIATKRKSGKDVTDEFNKRPGHLVPHIKKESFKTGGIVIECTFVENSQLEFMLNATDIELRNSLVTDAFAIMDIPTDSEKKSYDELHLSKSTRSRNIRLTYVKPSIMTYTEPSTNFNERGTSSSLHALLAKEEVEIETLE